MRTVLQGVSRNNNSRVWKQEEKWVEENECEVSSIEKDLGNELMDFIE